MPKRNKRNGFVYLLEAVVLDGPPVYKYGCTTSSVEQRLYRTNLRFRGEYLFRVICVLKSSDAFGDEGLVRWGILPSGQGALGEVFQADEGDSRDQVRSKFISILKHCGDPL
jgi:hypothetical protein